MSDITDTKDINDIKYETKDTKDTRAKETKNTKYILSLTGGGVRDLMPAHLLDLIFTELELNTSPSFDLIVGTSGGGILSLYSGLCSSGLCSQGLCSEQKSSQNLNFTQLFSQENLQSFLNPKGWKEFVREIQFETPYEGQSKTKLLQTYFGNMIRLSDLTHQKILIPAYNYSQRKTDYFRSYSIEHRENKKNEKKGQDPFLWQIADATSATVPYLPAVLIDKDIYIDGGYAVNNPVLLAYTEARKLFGNATPLRILSLGTGKVKPLTEDNKSALEWGPLQWIYQGLISTALEAPDDFMAQQTEELMKEQKDNRLLCLNPLLEQEISFDDTSTETLTYLKQVAQVTFQKHQRDLQDFFNLESSKHWFL